MPLVLSFGGEVKNCAIAIGFESRPPIWNLPLHFRQRTSCLFEVAKLAFNGGNASRVSSFFRGGYYKGERMGEARLLNAIANDRKPLAASSTINSQPSAEI